MELIELLTHTEECRGGNKVYVQLAIVLAVQTGMRLQEIFNLRVDDVGLTSMAEFEKRRIIIRKSKTDYKTGLQGRTIVMSVGARAILMSLAKHFVEDNQKPHRLELFPMTKEAFKRAWLGVVRRAGINDITFHDLRHEAGSRFDELGLTKAEHDLMMGHKSRDITSLYIHADLKRIQEKLDKPIYEKVKTREARKVFGLPFLGDEVEEDQRGLKFENLPIIAIMI